MDRNAALGTRLTYFVKAAELTQRVASTPVFEEHGLSYAQVAMLLSVARAEASSAAALARMHGVTAQSAGEVIAALVRQGLMERRPAPDHGRILSIHLTERGRALVDAVQAPLDALDRELTQGLTAREIATAKHVLRTIVANGRIVAEPH